MKRDFPKQQSAFLKAENFQDQLLTLTYKGWDQKTNEDRPARGKMSATTWKQTLKYQLRYSYPEFQLDEAGEKVLDDAGNPRKNKNYDPAYPHGYSITYHFEEGTLESGSYPLFNAFCLVRPAPGDRLVIGKTGKDKETVWSVKKVQAGQTQIASSDKDIPDIDYSSPEYSGDPNPDETPF